MIRRFLASAALLLAVSTLAQAAPGMPSRTLDGPAEAPEFFHASQLPAVDIATLPPPEKKSGPTVDENGRLRIASVRALGKAAPMPEWTPVADGYVTRVRATSEGALGLRVNLQVGRLAAPIEIHAQGTDGRIESMVVEPGRGLTPGSDPDVWTPWTEGATQVIELFSPAGAPIPSASVVGVLHFDQSPLQKVASSCTVPTSCSTGDGTLDAAVAERTKSSVRITFVDNGGGFVCSSTLINSDRFPAAYLLTANHCVSTQQVASTVTALYFYNTVSCDDTTVATGFVQQSGGSQLVFTNYNPDSTLLLHPSTPPSGAVYSGWTGGELGSGDAVVSISHPHGDTARLAIGNITREYRINNRAQDEYGVKFTSGIIEPGSSGSGLFTLSGGSLLLRGILTGTTVRNSDTGMSCTDLDEEALYGRFQIFMAEIAQYIGASGPVTDDTPNRVSDWAGIAPDAPLNDRTATFDRNIEFVGDVDVFRFTLGTAANVSLASVGSMDTVGTLMDANGKMIEANDDGTLTNTNFGISHQLDPGTYYVMVAPWDPQVTGAYRLVMSAATTASTPTSSSTNYTDLWWGGENGWGINLAHQGDILFGVLYTYDTDGSPMWLYMSNGNKQSDGSYSGTLYHANGPFYGVTTWSPIYTTGVGTMRITFTSSTTGTLTYSVYGSTVTKSIQRFAFASPPTVCTSTSGDRSGSTNYQDLWWNPNESGWGVTVAHEGNTLFALLYVYDGNTSPRWFSMSSGGLVGPRTYSGALYTASGPPFYTTPWTPATLTQVGNMTFTFTDGNHGTLSYTVNGIQVVKQITRTVFSNPQPLCSSS